MYLVQWAMRGHECATTELSVEDIVSASLETVSSRIKSLLARFAEMAYQLELRYGELANEEEVAVAGNPLNAGGTAQTGRQAKVAGDSSTPREMESIYGQIDSANEVTSAATNTEDLEAELISAHLATYNAGGNPGYAVTDPYTAGYFPSFAQSAGRTRDIRNERQLINVIDLYVSQYGELDVVLDRNMIQNTADAGDPYAGENAILLLDFNYLATPVLRATRDWELAMTGDSLNRQILRESTFAVLNTKAHAYVDAVPLGLAPPP